MYSAFYKALLPGSRETFLQFSWSPVAMEMTLAYGGGRGRECALRLSDLQSFSRDEAWRADRMS